MKYSIKWVTEHMGITRDMIREYEKQGIIDKKSSQNPDNRYREYDEGDLRKLWTIKLLIEVGFKIKQIKAFFDGEEQNFEHSIEELLAKRKEELSSLTRKINLIENILWTGRMPDIKKVGTVTINDFMDSVYKCWGIPSETGYFEFLDFFFENSVEKQNIELSDDTFMNLKELASNSGINRVIAYSELIFELDEDYHSRIVQTIVDMMYKTYKTIVDINECKTDLSKKLFAKHYASLFIEGKIGQYYRSSYGELACQTIADAISYYAGFENYNTMLFYFEGKIK